MGFGRGNIGWSGGGCKWPRGSVWVGEAAPPPANAGASGATSGCFFLYGYSEAELVRVELLAVERAVAEPFQMPPKADRATAARPVTVGAMLSNVRIPPAATSSSVRGSAAEIAAASVVRVRSLSPVSQEAHRLIGTMRQYSRARSACSNRAVSTSSQMSSGR